MWFPNIARRLWREGGLLARASSIGDSTTFVRVLFLSTAARLNLPSWFAGGPLAFADVAAHLPHADPGVLRAWLQVGVELGELGYDQGRYHAKGRRLRALVAGDALLLDHYRSFTEYQAGVYEQLVAPVAGGRTDLSDHARTIAGVSRAVEPFVAAFLAEALDGSQARRVLDVGCGTGVHLREMLRLLPDATGVGLDLSADVAQEARSNLGSWRLDDRATALAADVLTYTPGGNFDVVTLINCIYYFPGPARRVLLDRVGTLLPPGGRLLIVTQTAPGSVAAAHLDLMLRVQRHSAALPGLGDVVDDLHAAGFSVGHRRRVVPREPFWGLSAIRER